MLKREDDSVIRKSFSGEQEIQKAGDADLEAINKHAIAALAADDVFIGKLHLANTLVDRSHERFTKAVLQRFADTLPGKSMLTGHSYETVPVGRFFDATVEKTADGHALMARYYMDASDPLVRKVKSGIAKHVSIGFKADTLFCDLDGLDYSGAKSADGKQCQHIAGQTYEGSVCTLTYGGDLTKFEAIEGSLVYLGCQFGAQTIGNEAPAHRAKAAYLSALKPENSEDDMDLKEALAEIDRLKAELAKAGDAALQADGKAYREHLKGEITRMAGQVEKSGTYSAVLKHMESADSSSLVPIVDELKKEVEAKFPPSPHGKDAPPPKQEGNDGQTKKFDPMRRAAMPWERDAAKSGRA